MGNRVSTSATPLSLEELDALARGPSFFDIFAPDGAGGRDASCQETIRTELERRHAEFDTCVHALRCVRDRSGGPHQRTSSDAAARDGDRLPTSDLQSSARCPISGSTSTAFASDPCYTDPNGMVERMGRSNAATASLVERDAIPSLKSAGELRHSPPPPRQTRCKSTTKGMRRNAPPPALVVAAADATVTSAEAKELPRSWKFRDVSVLPFDLTRSGELRAEDVFIVVVVQRTTVTNRALSSTITTPITGSLSVANTRSATPLLSLQGFPSGNLGCSVHASASSGATPAAAATTTTTSVTSVNPIPGSAEWPREMIRVFTPRGLATAFSSDMTRPTLPTSSGGGAWAASLSASPRTTRSTSSHPTPRSTTINTTVTAVSATATGAVAGGVSVLDTSALPRSTPSHRTPRSPHLQFSVHLLTGKQADAITAAAGLFAARAVERLFLECHDFAYAVFHHLYGAMKEAILRGGSTCATSKKGREQSSGTGRTRRNRHDDDKPIRNSPGTSGTREGGAPGAVDTADNGSPPAASITTNGATPRPSPSPRPVIRGLAKVKRLELLTMPRPALVVMPHAAPLISFPMAYGTGHIGNDPGSTSTRDLTSLPAASTPAAVVVPSNTAELYSLNAVYRVLSGARVGTPRLAHSGDSVGSTAIAGYYGPGGLQQDFSSPARLPHRGTSAHGGGDGTAGSSLVAVPSLNLSSWLQGPQPLDVQRATPAVHTAALSAESALPAGSPSTTPRLGRPLRRTWGGASTGSLPTSLPASGWGQSVGDRRGAGLGSAEITTVVVPSHLAATAAATAVPSLNLHLDSLRALSSGAARGPFTGPPLRALPRGTSAVPASIESLAASETGNSRGKATHPCTAEGVSAAWYGGSDDGEPLSHSFSPHHHTRDGRAFENKDDTDYTGYAGHPIIDKTELARTSYTQQRGGGSVTAANGINASEWEEERDGEGESLNEVQTQEERAHRLKAAQLEVTEVLPHLFVGGEDAARDQAQLLRKGITHVVNTTSWCLDNFYPDLFRYMTLNLSDAAEEPIYSLFPSVNAFIEEAWVRHKGHTFIHCQQGVSRSCTFVIAYVMWKYGMCYDRAYEWVRARRKVCSPNLGFLMNLRLWEAQLSTPLLNCVYAFVPYTPTSPKPYTYQLVAYFDCPTPCTATTAKTTDAAPSSASSLLSSRGGLPHAISPRRMALHQQLRSDVLRGVANYTGQPPASMTLDPRLSYCVLLSPQPPSTLAGGSEDGNEAASCVTAFALVGSQCCSAEYKTLALTGCDQLLRFGFYHGETHSSTTNAGKRVEIAALLPPRLLPAAASRCTSSTPPLPLPLPSVSMLSFSPTSGMPQAEAQQLLSAHVAGEVKLQFARLPEWDALFATTAHMAEDLRDCIAEEEQLDATEAARESARKLALCACMNRRGTAASFPSSTSRQAVPVTLAPLVKQQKPLSSPSRTVRGSGRSTPRRPQQPSAAAPAAKNSSRRSSSQGYAVVAQAAHSASSSVRRGNRSGTALTPSTALGSSRTPFGTSTASGRQSSASSDRAKINAGNGRLVHVTAALPEGESFAYEFPFTAASKVVVSDLDDLAEDRCYVLGFQKRSGMSVYIWRGAEAMESVSEVMDAFLRSMLITFASSAAASSQPSTVSTKAFTSAAADAPAVLSEEAAAEALEAGLTVICTLRFPQEDEESCDEEAAAAVSHATVNGDDSRSPSFRAAPSKIQVMPNAHVLYVEQGDEPKEFFTLL